MKKTKIEDEEFVKDLLKLVSEKAGCKIQYNNCPCNTCFHTWAEDIGLSNNMAHLFWIVILALRGDYTEKELLESNKDNFKDLIN